MVAHDYAGIRQCRPVGKTQIIACQVQFDQSCKDAQVRNWACQPVMTQSQGRQTAQCAQIRDTTAQPVRFEI